MDIVEQYEVVNEIEAVNADPLEILMQFEELEEEWEDFEEFIKGE